MRKPWFNEIQLALITVYVIVAVDVFGLTLIVPVIVTYARYLNATEAAIGYLYAVYSGMALIGSLFVGRLSDRYGRRVVFLYCCVGAIASFAGSALSTTFVQFAVCRGISGLFTGTMGNAYAYIGDLVAEKDKAKYISYVTATMSTCFVIGPIIGGGFAVIDIRAPFIAACAMAIVELLLIWFFVHDPAERVDAAGASSNEATGISDEGIRTSDAYSPLLHPGDEESGSFTLTPNTHPAGTSTAPTAPSHPPRNVPNDDTEEAGFVSLNDPSVPPLSRAEDDTLHLMAQEEHHDHTCTAATTATGTEHSDDSSTGSNTSTCDTASPLHPATTSSSAGPASSMNTLPTTVTAYAEPADVSPWLNLPALLIGGVGMFLSTTTYCGMAILVPFLLMDPSFGIVSDNSNNNDDINNGGDSGDDDGISSGDSKKLSLIIGYLLTILGTVQVFGMLVVFPYVNKRLGLMYTGGVGAALYGATFCLLVLVDRLSYLFPIVVGLAAGYSLCRPVYPAYLSIVAHKNRRADYQTMSTCFNQVKLDDMTVTLKAIRYLFSTMCNALQRRPTFNFPCY